MTCCAVAVWLGLVASSGRVCSTADGVWIPSSQAEDGKRPRLRVTFAP